MSINGIRASQYSVGKEYEELLVPTADCPIKRHGRNDDCTCIHKNRYTEYTAPCPYYKGYKEAQDKKETVVLVQCEGKGKPVIPLPEPFEKTPTHHSSIKSHQIDIDSNVEDDKADETTKQNESEPMKDTDKDKEPNLFDYM